MNKLIVRERKVSLAQRDSVRIPFRRDLVWHSIFFLLDLFSLVDGGFFSFEILHSKLSFDGGFLSLIITFLLMATDIQKRFTGNVPIRKEKTYLSTHSNGMPSDMYVGQSVLLL